MVGWLVNEQGAPLDDRTALGATAFMCAAESGNLETARWLAEAGADAEARGAGGVSALMLACSEHQVDVVRFLAEECRTDLAAVDDEGRSCLHRVTETPGPEAMALTMYLVGRGASMSARDAQGRDPWDGLVRGFYGVEHLAYEDFPENDEVFAEECLRPLLRYASPPSGLWRHTELIREGTQRRFALPAWRLRLSALVAGRGLPGELAGLVVALAEPGLDEFWDPLGIFWGPSPT